MKKTFLSVLMLAIALVAQSQNLIQTQVPIRPAGQTDVICLTVPKMDVVRIGVVGLGGRGTGAIWRLSQIEGAEIVALCDVRKEQVDNAQKIIKKCNRKPAAEYSGDTEVSMTDLTFRRPTLFTTGSLRGNVFSILSRRFLSEHLQFVR